MHTDLTPEAADAVLERMESTLRFAAEYWGRPPRGRIECYVVDDLCNWSDWALPHPLARIAIGGIGGVTVGHKVSAGKTTRNAAVIYASTVPGIAEHEVVHAYCTQNFGETGPQWYREGMAEMAVFGQGGVGGVCCPAAPLAKLRQGPVRSIRAILTTGHVGVGIHRSLDVMLANRTAGQRLVSLDAWTPEDVATIHEVRQEYLWSWALCYLLHNNPNYTDRFRTLGGEYVRNRAVSFEQVFASVAKEMMFEYAFFLQHLDVGYRVDLCHWDWGKRCRSLDGGDAANSRCISARGWQASELLVTEGQSYAYQATGSWSTATDLVETDANGIVQGPGRLAAVVMSEFRLSDPFLLGCQGTFVAPMTGRLHLRCDDAWNGLSDNRGELRVRITLPLGGE